MINIQNFNDDEWFKWYLAWYYLNPADHHPAMIRKIDKLFRGELNFEGITKLKKRIQFVLVVLVKKKENILFMCWEILSKHRFNINLFRIKRELQKGPPTKFSPVISKLINNKNTRTTSWAINYYYYLYCFYYSWLCMGEWGICSSLTIKLQSNIIRHYFCKKLHCRCLTGFSVCIWYICVKSVLCQ